MDEVKYTLTVFTRHKNIPDNAIRLPRWFCLAFTRAKIVSVNFNTTFYIDSNGLCQLNHLGQIDNDLDLRHKICRNNYQFIGIDLAT